VEWKSKDVLGERSHWLSIVVLDDSLEEWNGSLHLLLGKESQNTNLGKTSVVDLLDQTSFLSLGGLVLGKLERIEKVEWDWVRDAIRARNKVWVVTRGSTSHVMLVVRCGELTPELKESDSGEDLPLSVLGDVVPKGRWVCVGWEGSSVHLHGPWELDSVVGKRGRGDGLV
jgi:hypothetical protein